MPGGHKIGAAISGPRITGGNFMDTTIFLSFREKLCFFFSYVPFLLLIFGGGGGPEGGIAEIVCDTPKHAKRHGHCYTYLAIRGPILPGPLRM